MNKRSDRSGLRTEWPTKWGANEFSAEETIKEMKVQGVIIRAMSGEIGWSSRRVPMRTAEKALRLCREQRASWSVRNFHETLLEQHGTELGHRWVKRALQTAGLVSGSRRGQRARQERP